MNQAYFEDRSPIGIYTVLKQANMKHLPPHYHGAFELKCVLEGMVEVTINGMTETAVPGNFVMILPNQVHAFKSNMPAEIWTCKFTADYVQVFANHMADKQGDSALFTCDAAILESFRRNLFANERLLSRRGIDPHSFDRLPTDERAMRLFAIQGYLHIICCHFAEQAKLKPREDKKEDIIRQLIHYVSENFRDDVTLLGAAKALGYSRNYLSWSFHQQFKMNFKQFVNQYRLNCAQKLIKEDKVDIGKAALESGFGSVRNFNRVYREATGKAPSEME